VLHFKTLCQKEKFWESCESTPPRNMPATPSKLNTSSIVLRRSPRLNPPPRRSPRIEEQKQLPDEGVPEMDVGRAGIPDVHSPRLVHASPRSGTTPKSKSSTPSSARSPYVTPNIKTTPMSESSTSSKSTVTFRRTICAVQNFNGAEPSSCVKQRSVKRFFLGSSDESQEKEPKRKKIETHPASVLDHPISRLAVAGAVIIAIAVVFIRSFV